MLEGCDENGSDYVVPTNALWDNVTKQILLPGGTNPLGYGVDP